jgi:RNA polymerase sigma factor (sigma-70 family)
MIDKEYKIDIKIKNNLVWQQILKTGCKTVNEFCCKYNLSPTAIGEVINMKRPLINMSGEWCLTIKKLCDIFNCDPEDIVSEEQKSIVNNKKIELYADSQQLAALTSNNEKYASLEYFEEELDQEKINTNLREQLKTLTPREESILIARFGLDGEEPKKRKEIGEKFGISNNRIMQIEVKALRKLRSSFCADKLK